MTEKVLHAEGQTSWSIINDLITVKLTDDDEHSWPQTFTVAIFITAWKVPRMYRVI